MIEIYFNDLTKEKQQEILEALGENGNYDVFPIATISTYEEADSQSEICYPCDHGGDCPFNAVGGYDCRNFCGLGVDENESEEDYDY